MSRTKKLVTEFRNYELPHDFPVICLTGERWRISDVRNSNQHFHNCFEIGICHEFSGNIEFLGKPYPFHAGDVTCIPKNIPHTIYSSSGESSLWSYIFFNPADFFKNIISTSSHLMDFDKGAFSNHFLQVNEKNNPYFYSLANSIITEMTAKKPHYQIAVRGLLQALCIEMLRYQEHTAFHTETDTDKLNTDEQTYPQGLDVSAIRETFDTGNANILAPSLEYIEKNYMHSFTVMDLALECHLSETHFRRLFHSCIGTSPLDYVTYTRIMAACNLLRSTEDSILLISEAVGFHSISSFNRSFQKVMKRTPSTYRNEMLTTSANQAKPSIVECNGFL